MQYSEAEERLKKVSNMIAELNAQTTFSFEEVLGTVERTVDAMLRFGAMFCLSQLMQHFSTTIAENVSKEHDPHVLAPDEFGECGTGWIEHWCRLENDDGSLRAPEVFMNRCAWCGNSLTTGEFLISLDCDIPKDYGKSDAGGFRVWAGDFAPSEEMRKEAAWDG